MPYQEDSDVDNSDVEEGDTYLPISTEAVNDDDELGDDELSQNKDPSTDGHYKDFFKTNTFTYEPLKEGETLHQSSNMYDGEGPCLKRGVAKRFRTVLECVQLCGGFSYSFVKRLTSKSNA